MLTEDDGVYVHASRDLYLRHIEEVPEPPALEALLDELLRELSELRRAPSPGAFIGPALLSGQAAGTLFHEALGHRLEGERLTARGECKTFAQKRGERILPAGLDVYDDPRIDRFAGHALWGSYRVDDEGRPRSSPPSWRTGCCAASSRAATPCLAPPPRTATAAATAFSGRWRGWAPSWSSRAAAASVGRLGRAAARASQVAGTRSSRDHHPDPRRRDHNL